jgi:hypothetical protein
MRRSSGTANQTPVMRSVCSHAILVPRRRFQRHPFIATLHVGQVVYGNIGSPIASTSPCSARRSIWSAASRVWPRSWTSRLLCSAAFAAALDVPLASLGRFALKAPT